MAKVIHGDTGGNQLNVSADKAQAYGLKGNDTIISNNKKDVLLIGGSGNDSLIMQGGNGTLSGGKGSDVFELNYSASSTLSAVIEDFEPSSDEIIVNFDGNLPAQPQLNRNALNSGDVVLKDDNGLLNVTLKSVRENDYFDGSGSAADDERFFEVLELTNAERENPTMPKAPDVSADSKEYKKYTAEYEEQQKLVAEAKTKNLPLLTLSEGLAVGAAIRADETAMLGGSGVLDNHIRPNNQGGYSTVIVDKELNLSLSGKYSAYGENLQAGAESPEEVISDWIGSLSHHENILDERFQKLGVGYEYRDMGGLSESRYYWTQLFANGLNSPETVSTRELLSVSPEIHMTSKFVVGNDEANTIENTLYGATIDARGGDDSINNSALAVSISGGSGKDTIDNSGSFVTINAGTGDDQISLSRNARNNLIEYRAGDGNDTVSGFKSTDTLSIVGEEYTPVTVGNDIVVSVGSDSITLLNAARLSNLNIDGTRSKLFIGTDGDDEIPNTIDGAIINAKGGKDTVDNSGSSVTINAGKGDDKITLDTDAKNNLIQYASGDGNDTVDGFDANDTLSIAGEEYTPVKVREDLVVAVGNDSITLLDAASLSNPNIDGTRSKLFVGTTGGDTIINTVDGATIQALDGNDTVINSGKNVSIDAGAGNNSINNSDGTAIIAFNGQTTIENFHFGFGEGSDTVYIPKEAPAVDFKTDGLSLYTDNASLIFKNAKATSKVNMYYESQGTLNREVFIADDDWYVTNDNELNGDPLYFVGATAKMNHGVDFSNVTKDLDVTLNTDYVSNNANLWVNNVHSVKGGASYTTIHGSDKNDSIIAGTGRTTIDGSKGNDFISLPGDAKENLIEYRAGDGSDTVIGFDANDTLRIGDGKGNYSTQKSGKDVLVNVGIAAILLKDAAGLSSINIVGRSPIVDPTNPKFIVLTEEDYSYENSLDGATITALNGNHDINNYGAKNVSISGGSGIDWIYNNSTKWNEQTQKEETIGNPDNAIINGGAGDDTVRNYGGANVSISGGDGDDGIYNQVETIWHEETRTSETVAIPDNALIDGGGGKDYISNSGFNTTIIGGADDDTVWNDEAGMVYVYRAGDGNDLIYGFGVLDTLIIDGAEFTTVKNDSGSLLVKVGSNTITLNGAAGLVKPNIVSTTEDIASVNVVNNENRNTTINGKAASPNWIRNYAENVTINGGTSPDDIYNESANVVINGSDGNDYIRNWNKWKWNEETQKDELIDRGNDATIDGGAGDDSIRNDGNNVSISSGDGNDYIDNYGYNVTLNSGDGNDTIYIADDWEVSISSGAGNDSVINYSGNVSIDGEDGDDSISSGNVNATINGGLGNDNISLDAYSAHNLITYTDGDGNDTIYGYNPSDTLNLIGTSITSSVVTKVISGNNLILYVGSNSITFVDTRSVNVDGTIINPTSLATSGNDFINNFDSYVTISSPGNDTILNGGNNVLIDIGTDRKSIRNHGVNVTINGSNANDTILNGGENVSIRGGEGNDSISNGRWDATIDAGAGNDTVENHKERSSIIGGDGNDSIYSSDGWDVTIDAGTGNDTVGSHRERGSIIGGEGNDSIYNIGSNSTIDAGVGNDSIRSYNERCSIISGDGSDIISNSGSYSTIDAGTGNDSIQSYNERCSIIGGEGSDSIYNNGSNSTIDAGIGNDTVYNYYSGDHSYINLGEGNDSINSEDEDYSTIDGGDGDDSIIGRYWHSSITGGAGNDAVSLNYAYDTTVDSGDGNDTIIAEEIYSSSINGGDGDDLISVSSISYWSSSTTTVRGGAGNDTIIAEEIYSSSINGGDGDDLISVSSSSDYSNTTTVRGGAGNDTIFSSISGSSLGSYSHLLVEGDEGNDHIVNWSDSVTTNGGTGDDLISLDSDAKNNLIQYTAGDGFDTVRGFNETDLLQIGNGTGTYSTQTSGNDVIVTVGDGSILLEGAASLSAININAKNIIELTAGDDVYPSNIFPSIADNVTIAALGGNDSITNRNKSNVSISGAAGSDTIENQGNKATLDGGDDNDFLSNGTSSLINSGKFSFIVNNKRGGSNVSINGGAGDDSISNNGSNATIVGGTGNDQITLASTSQNNVIRYAAGDGNDTIWGIQDNDTLNLFPENVQYSKERVQNTNDMIIKIGGGSILLKNAANKRTKITLGESGTSGGTVGDGGGDNSSSGSGGGNDGKDNSQGGPSTNAGKNNAATQGRSATGSSGRGTSTSTSESGGNGSRRNPTATHSASTSTQQTSSNNFDNVLNSLQQNQSATPTVNQHVYAGGNQIISNYQSGEKIIFGADYTGSFFDGAGNFIVGSSTGALVVQNAIGKVIDLSDGVGNSFLNAYAATNAGVIDWRGLSGFEVINGSAGADVVYASDGGSQLYGGVDNLTDVLVGGAGVDIFVVGKTQGADIILNASAEDLVYLNDATISDIVAVGEIDGTINLAFNTGNVIAVQSSEALSSTFMLADGSAYQYNNATKTWQVTQYVYAGGNMVISDYESAQKILFKADYAGATFDDAGNFVAGSSTGALVVQNATDKFIDLKDYAGNAFVEAYAATAAGIIDGRGRAGFELINGSAGEDVIYAGDGGSQLWGGVDSAADTLVGGNGTDIFIGGKTQGKDIFLNASSTDIVHLNDATLSDIIATEENNGNIAIAFNNGNAVGIQSTEPLSAAVMLADGSAYRYNHTNKSWQSA